MGSSGAGKTTLMDVIAGRKTGDKIRGQITLHGQSSSPIYLRANIFNISCGNNLLRAAAITPNTPMLSLWHLPHTPTLSDIQALFDGVLKKFPAAKKHLVARPTDENSKTVLISPNFESGVVKVLRGNEADLSTEEIKSLEGSSDARLMTTRTRTCHSRRCAKRPRSRSLEVERLFSRAGLVLSERRQRMYPSTLEKLLMLEYNDHLWDAYTVAEAPPKAAVLRREEARKRQRKAE